MVEMAKDLVHRACTPSDNPDFEQHFADVVVGGWRAPARILAPGLSIGFLPSMIEW